MDHLRMPLQNLSWVACLLNDMELAREALEEAELLTTTGAARWQQAVGEALCSRDLLQSFPIPEELASADLSEVTNLFDGAAATLTTWSTSGSPRQPSRPKANRLGLWLVPRGGGRAYLAFLPAEDGGQDRLHQPPATLIEARPPPVRKVRKATCSKTLDSC